MFLFGLLLIGGAYAYGLNLLEEFVEEARSAPGTSPNAPDPTCPSRAAEGQDEGPAGSEPSTVPLEAPEEPLSIAAFLTVLTEEQAAFIQRVRE